MKGPLVVFDMDGVLVLPRSSWRYVHEHLGTSNEDSFRSYMEGSIDDEEFMERDITLWRKAQRDLSIDDIEAILGTIEPIKGFNEALRRLKEGGITTMIISGGLDLLADCLKQKGGFERSMANGLMTLDDGQLEGRGILKVPLRDKGSVLRGIIEEGYGPVAAVGDSMVDVPMFDMADISIAFRPEVAEVADRADHVVSEGDLSKVADIVIQGFKGHEQ